MKNARYINQQFPTGFENGNSNSNDNLDGSKSSSDDQDSKKRIGNVVTNPLDLSSAANPPQISLRPDNLDMFKRGLKKVPVPESYRNSFNQQYGYLPDGSNLNADSLSPTSLSQLRKQQKELQKKLEKQTLSAPLGVASPRGVDIARLYSNQNQFQNGGLSTTLSVGGPGVVGMDSDALQ